jgi:hypothetical protein
VHKLPGDAVAAPYPPGDRDSTLASFRRRQPVLREASFRKLGFANQVSQTEFRKSGKPRIALNGLPREDHYKPDKVPNGVRWKNLLRRHLPSSAALPEIRFLKFVSGLCAYWSWRRDLNP